MEYRTLELILISAKGLKKISLIGNMDVYAVASIYGTTGKDQKEKTPVHKDGGSNPSWNFPIKFTIDESAALQNRLTLVVKIKALGTFGNKDLGQVQVPIKELMEGVGKGMQFVNYPVRKPSGKPKGELSFSYKFGEKVLADKPVHLAEMAIGSSSAYPPPFAVGGGYYRPPVGYLPQPQDGHTYQHQQQPGHSSYPPPPPPPVGYPPPLAAAAGGGYYRPPFGYPPQPQAGHMYQHQQQPSHSSYPPPPPPPATYPPQQGYGYPPVLGMGLGAFVLLGTVLDDLLKCESVWNAAFGGGGGCGGG